MSESMQQQQAIEHSKHTNKHHLLSLLLQLQEALRTERQLEHRPDQVHHLGPHHLGPHHLAEQPLPLRKF